MASALGQSQLFGSSYDMVMADWEPKENQAGVVYFVNNQRKVTSWVHPYVSKVFEELGEFNNVKYAAYRTALKLRFLQVKLGLNLMTMKSIKEVFSIRTDDNSNGSNSEDAMSCREIFGVVYKIMELSDSFRLYRAKLVQASETILNLILESFDPSRTGKVAKRSVRLALVVLCSAKLSDKYRFFFDEISNNRGQIQREKFLYLIYDLMQITELLKESTAFGTNVSAAVNSCLKNCKDNSGTNGDNSSSTDLQGHHDDFYSWLLQEPICIVWLPTLHRVVATESIRHNIQCSVCGIQPMVGFRYRCMQCLRYDLCQLCFFQGMFSQSHRLKHPMQEYCFPTTRKDDTKALLKIVRNKMSKRHRRTKIKLLPVDDDSITGSVFQWQPRSLIPNPKGSFHSSTDSGLAVGSSDNDVDYPETPSGWMDQAYDKENLALMKRWCKPVEVLGEPCDTSSPCVQENMTKKNMDIQQLKMTQTIQQLQEENRMLRQKLSAVRKRELEKSESESSRSESSWVQAVPGVIPVEVEVYDNNRSGDPLKEITTDAPISPINHLGQSDTLTTKMPGNCQDISVNVLEIVGSYTPIQSTFCLESQCDDSKKRKKGSASGGSTEESGISDDGSGHDSVAGSVNGRSGKGSDILCQEHSRKLLSQPLRNPPMITDISTYTTETESTTSNDLEYTYSDMSLKSEAPSSRSSKSSKTRGFVTFDCAGQADGVVQVGHDLKSNNERGHNCEMDTAGGDSSGLADHTSDFLTPNTTNNESSVEMDAFKLCQMKFKTPEQALTKKAEERVFDVSNSQPCLIYSSKNLHQNETRKGDNDDNSCDSFRASRIVIDESREEKKTPTSLMTSDQSQLQLHSLSKSSFDPSFDLSVIPAHDSVASFSFAPKSASSLPTYPTSDPAGNDNCRRKTMEPVYMSTPVADTLHRGTSLTARPVYRKKSNLAKKVLMKQQHEKENQSPLFHRQSGRSRSSNSISGIGAPKDLSMSPKSFHFHQRGVVSSSSFGATPKSSIPPRQRQRILQSMNCLESNRSYSCSDLTFDPDIGMTTLFDRAEHQRTVGAGSQSLPLEDKQELERLIDQIRIGESESSVEVPASVDGVADSSILQAVLHIGDAMADFVQATADVHLRRESTHL